MTFQTPLSAAFMGLSSMLRMAGFHRKTMAGHVACVPQLAKLLLFLGEEVLRHDNFSLEVKGWFQQLRRMQSLVHAVRAVKQSGSIPS